MALLRWLSGFVVLFVLMGVLFSIGGNLINILLIVATIVFIIDAVSITKKSM